MLNFEFILRETWINVRRNGLIGLAAASTVLVSLCVLGTFGLLVLNTDLMTRQEAERLDVQAFLKKGVSAERARQIHQQLMALSNVTFVQFISEDAALREVESEFKGLDLSRFKKHKHNPLPASFRIQVAPVDQIPMIAKSLERMREVDSVQYVDEAWSRIVTWNRVFKAGIGVLGAALIFGVLVIINNTIRLTVFARRREIRIMQLVGATHWFVRIPFLLEGIFYGVVGGFAACVVLCVGYMYGISFLQSQFGQHHLPALVSDAGTLARFLTGVLLLGFVFGLGGSYLTTRRFLR